MRRTVREVVDTRKEARKMRETFMSRGVRGEKHLPFTWPKEMRLVGKCIAVMYTSDKWKTEPDFEDYKHLAEAPQEALLRPDFALRRGKQGVSLYGPSVELIEPMPKHFAELAPLLGVQVQIFDQAEHLGKGGDRLLEFRIPRAMLGGARHPQNHEPFLLIYVEGADGVLAMVTGRELDIEKDGIVG